MIKAIATGNSKSGKLAITKNANNTYTLWVQKSNYSKNTKSGIAKTWCYIVKNTSFDECMIVLKRRSI